MKFEFMSGHMTYLFTNSQLTICSVIKELINLRDGIFHCCAVHVTNIFFKC